MHYAVMYQNIEVSVLSELLSDQLYHAKYKETFLNVTGIDLKDS